MTRDAERRGLPPMDERLRRSAEAAAMARATPPPDPHWGWIPPPDADEAVRRLAVMFCRGFEG